MKLLPLILLLILSISSFGEEREQTMFSFTTTSNKLCSIVHDTISNTLYYRYGTSSSVELEVQDDLSDTTVVFTYSYYFRGGGVENAGLDLNSVIFVNGGYTYEIYSNSSAETGNHNIGITVSDSAENIVADIKGVNKSQEGSLVNFRFNYLIPVGE